MRVTFKPTYRPNKNGLCALRAFLHYGTKTFELTTQIKIPLKYWKNGQITNPQAQQEANELAELIQQACKEITNKNQKLDKNSLKSRLYVLQKQYEPIRKAKERVSTAKAGKQQSPTITFLDALTLFEQIRKSENNPLSVARDKSYFKCIKEFFKGMLAIPLKNLGKQEIFAFLDYLTQQRKVKAITRNNYLSWLKCFFNKMIERGFILQNPCKEIKELREQEPETIAFAQEHIKDIFRIVKEADTELFVFCAFIFYTFIRPIELRRLKVGQVYLPKENENGKVFIKGEQSKNRRSETVLLPPPLVEILQKTKFLERDKNDFLFSDYKELHYSRNKFSVKFRELMKANGYPDSYKLYGLKHTGVVTHFKNGFNIYWIRKQCRHSSIEQTDKYLKDLGLLYDNPELMQKAPKIE
jgi:integrase